MREGVDIGLLKYVLSLDVVIQNGAGDPVKPLIVTLDDQQECGGVALSRAFNQPRVVKILDSLLPRWARPASSQALQKYQLTVR